MLATAASSTLYFMLTAREEHAWRDAHGAGKKLGSQPSAPLSGCDVVVWLNAAGTTFRQHQNRPDWRCLIPALTFEPVNLDLVAFRSLTDRIGDNISKFGDQGVVGFGAPEVQFST